GRNRYGDFSAISVDPTNPNAFWIAEETIVPGNPALTTRTQVWGTQMSEIVFGNSAAASGSLTVNNLAPVVHLTVPALSTQSITINTPVSFAGFFTDPGSTLGETYTATWTFDAASQAGALSGTNVTATHTFTVAGVYDVVLTVTDSNSGVGSANTDGNGAIMRVVIFDPSARFVTGGGPINLPPGSLGSRSPLTR